MLVNSSEAEFVLYYKKLRLDNCAEYCNYYWALVNTVKNIQFPKRQIF